MRYILCPKAKALEYRFTISHHTVKGAQVVLNEKEVLCSPALAEGEGLTERAALLEGTVYNSSTEILNIIND